MGPCFFLLFSPPRGLAATQLFLWLVIFSILFRGTSAVYRIPYMSLGAELSQDYAERTVVIAVRSLMGLLGMLAAGGLSFLLFFPARTDGIDPKMNYSSYPHLGLVFGAVMSIAGLVTCFGTLAHRKTVDFVRAASSATSFFSGFGLSMRNRDFRSLWIIRINAAVRERGLRYSQFIHALEKAKIQLDRKSLAEMAVSDPTGFDAIVEQAKGVLAV